MAKSIYDVAQETGLSVSTVSRALNGYSDVSAKTRARVVEAAEKLGYVPNTSAKNLSSKNNKNVALIVCGLLDEMQSNEFMMWIIQGAYSYMMKHGVKMAMYSMTEEEQDKKDFDTFCREYSLSGAIIMGLRTTDTYVKTLASTNMPFVTIDIPVDGPMGASVMTDDRKAFEEITSYVIEKGHKDLVLVYGRKKADVAVRRYQGFNDALEKYGMDIRQCKIIYTDFFERNAYNGTKKLLKEQELKPGTAFICMSDLTAVGVLSALKEEGYQVPEDFSITGYDGNELMKYITPFITRINQNMGQKGYDAAKLLMKMIRGEEHQKIHMTKYLLEEGQSVKEL